MIVIGGASDFGIWRSWGRLVHMVGVWVVVIGLEGGMDGLGWEVMTMIPPFSRINFSVGVGGREGWRVHLAFWGAYSIVFIWRGFMNRKSRVHFT
jgi:hypothetical protein